MQSNEEDVCVICQDEKGEKEIGIVPCNHEFHFECIQKWSNVKNDCPCCRKKFRKIIKKESEIEIEVKDVNILKKEVEGMLDFQGLEFHQLPFGFMRFLMFMEHVENCSSCSFNFMLHKLIRRGGCFCGKCNVHEKERDSPEEFLKETKFKGGFFKKQMEEEMKKKKVQFLENTDFKIGFFS